MDPDRVSAFVRRESSLAEQELIDSLSWLIRLRWVAGAGVIAGTWLAATLLDIPLQVGALAVLGIGVLAYNALLLWGWRQLNARDTSHMVYQWFARFQIGLDWLIGDWVVNANVRYIQIETSARIGGDLAQALAGTGAADIGDVKIDPWVYSLNVGYRF